MVDSNSENDSNLMKIWIRGFLGWLIMNPLSDLKNFERQIQDGDKKWKTAIISIKRGTKGLIESLIMDPSPDFKNSRSRIQYGGERVKNCDRLGKNCYEVVFDVADYEFFIRFPRFIKSDSKHLNRIGEIMIKLERIIALGILGLPDTVLGDDDKTKWW